MTSVAVNAGPMAWRLRIRNQSTYGNPDGTADAIVLSSVPGTGFPLIAAEPSGDGAQLDPLGGTTVTANYRVNIIDAGTSGQTLAGIIPGPGVAGGVITSQLGDSSGRSQLISRRCYLEESFDGGNTWPICLCAGYVNRIRLITATSYEFTVGETRRLEQTVPLFQTIAPGLDQGTCIMGGPIAWQQTPLSYATAVIQAPAWSSLVTYSTGDPVMLNGGLYVATTSSVNQTPPNTAYWMQVTGNLTGGAQTWASGPTYDQGTTVVASDGRTYLALQTNSGSDPTTSASDWIQIGPTLSSAPQYSTVPALPWNPGTSYVPGNTIMYQGIEYICVAGNTNDPPPDTAHWAAIPTGAPTEGVWSNAVTYYPGTVVVGQDGNPYVCIVQSFGSVQGSGEPPGGGLNPVQDIENTYWVPVAALDFGTWGSIPDYGGMQCLVVATGETTATLKVNPIQGYMKVPSPKSGDAAWVWVQTGPSPTSGFPSKYVDYVNSFVPALVQGYGPSPVGYGATYLAALTGPRIGSAPAPIGVTDTFTDGSTIPLGWVAGAIAAQIRTQSGAQVTTNVYTQTLNQSADSGRQFTQTPVVLSQGPSDPGTFYVDWHDFYQVNAAGQPVAPVGQNGQSVSMPAVGSTVYVKLVAVPITSTWPLHISMHPVDLLTTLWNTLQIPYDVANVADVRSALGDDLVLLLQITESMTASQVFEQFIGGPLGVGLRVSSSQVQSQYPGVVCGCYQLVLTRTPPSALPTVAWTDSDVYGEPGHEQPIYDLDEATTCQQVSYSYESFVPWTANSSVSRPGDDAVVINNTMTYDSEDYAVFGTTTEQYSIAGGYGCLSIQQAQTMSQLGQNWSNYIFERFSRGATQTTVFILASSPQADLGDLVLWESNRMPNPALNQRGGVRLCQVVKKTFHAMGTEYVLDDLGAAEQPAETPPTITLAADAADPYHTVDLTVTNLVALQADYPSGSIQVQGIVQDTEPGSAQSGTVVADVSLSMMSSGAIVMPAVAMGATVWYRANVRPGAGALPSVWTAWTSITLGSPGSITGLTATVQSGGQCLLTWTNPDADLTTPVAIWLASGTPAATGSYSVLVSNASFTLEAGDTLQLSAQTYASNGVLQTGSTYSYASSATGIATVNASTGVVTAVTAGSVTITVTDTTSGRGSPTGESFGTITPAAGVGRIVVTPSPFQMATSATPIQLTAVVYDTNGNVIGSPTVTASSSPSGIVTTSVAGSVVTVTPTGSVGSVTVTVSSGGVNQPVSGAVTATYTNLAQAARASGNKHFLLSVVQSYPSDNFAMVGGVVNTALGLPNISTNYGNFTPGDTTGKVWPELLDINGVLAFSSSATASATNSAAIASISSQIVIQTRVLVDSIRNLPASSGAGLLCIGATPTTDKKCEMYIQSGSSGTAQLTGAAYETGSVRSAVVSTSAVALTAFPPAGCWVNCLLAIDTSSAKTITVWMYDDNGNVIATNSASLSTALSTDGGANGCLFLNQAFNTAAGPTSAVTYGGLAVISGTVQAAPARWQPATAGTTGITALYLMGDAVSGTVSAIQHTYTGENFTTSGTVTGTYDNGGPYNWLLWNGSVLTSGPGGECVDENQWKEFHFISSMTGPTTITFNYGPDPTVEKCRSVGIVSRAYLFQGSAGSAISEYATYITSAGTATAALQAIVTGMVGRYVSTYGTAAQGGIRVWNIANEFMEGGVWQNSIWYQYLGAAWVPMVAAMVYAIDPTAMIMINFDNIELASDAAQQAAVPAVVNAIIAKGIPADQIIVGHEFHLDNVHQYTQQDAQQFATYVDTLPSGVLATLSEPDITDIALEGASPPSSSRSAREVLSNETWQMVYGSNCLANAGVWARCWGTGAWEKSSLTSWLNIDPPAGSSRTDGDFEESSIVDENYNYYGGFASDADIYTTIMDFLALQAAA